MKTISVQELQKHVKEVVASAQHDRVVVTRHGEQAAVLLGVEGKDWETVVLETGPAFWDLTMECVYSRKSMIRMAIGEVNVSQDTTSL